jgi:hypothetical protein
MKPRVLLTLVPASLLLAVGLGASPAEAAPATVTTMCTEFGTALLPENAPPVRGGVITVEVNGQIITTQAVPGPCNAPGFVKVVTT